MSRVENLFSKINDCTSDAAFNREHTTQDEII